MEKGNTTCCPKCHSQSVRPDREISIWDFFYTLILQRAMRCKHCRYRFGAPYDPTLEKARFKPKRFRRFKHNESMAELPIVSLNTPEAA